MTLDVDIHGHHEDEQVFVVCVFTYLTDIGIGL